MVGISALFGTHQKTQVPTPIAQAPQVQSQNLSGFNPTGGGTYRLQSSLGLAGTTINLSSFKEPISGIPYTMTYLNSSIMYGTLDPVQPTLSEFVSFTGITQNSDGTASLTGVTRGLSRTPGTGGCVASTTLATSHSGQSIFILSNSPCFYSQYAATANDNAFTGSNTFPEPTGASNVATKNYVDTHVNGGPVSVDKLIPAATAGETISAGQVVYFQQSASQWFKASVSIPEASSTILGIAQGSGTAGVAISGGVMLAGLDVNQSGLTAGKNYFLGSTAGTISSATSTRVIGRAKSATTLYVDTTYLPNTSLNNTFTGINTFTGTSTFSSTGGIVVNPANVLDPSGNAPMWTFLGSTTYSGAGTSMTVSNLPARTLLHALIYTEVNNTVGRNAPFRISFNGDTGINYSASTTRANTSTTGAIGIPIQSNQNTGGVLMSNLDIFNVSTTTKLVQIHSVDSGYGTTSATANNMVVQDITGIWATSTPQSINSITLTDGNADNPAFLSGKMYIYGSAF